MTDKPTQVLTSLPISEAGARIIRAAMETPAYEPERLSAALLGIGTPVTGGEFFPIGYINEDAICGLATGVYQSASIFREEDAEHYDTVALIRQSDTVALLAACDAEIAQLREENEQLKRVAYSGRGTMARTIHSPARFADAPLKGGAV